MAMKKFNKRKAKKFAKQKGSKQVQYNQNDRYKPSYKRIAWFWVSVIALVALFFGFIYFYTGAFYAENLQSWQMQTAWFCPYDYKIYEGNKNALISREYIDVKDGDKTLVISLDAEKVKTDEAPYVYYSVVYYSGDKCVGQSEIYKLEYDKLAGEESKFIVWKYSDIADQDFYPKGDVGQDFMEKSYKVDSVKISIFYDCDGESISLFQRDRFSNAVYFEYVEKDN